MVRFWSSNVHPKSCILTNMCNSRNTPSILFTRKFLICVFASYNFLPASFCPDLLLNCWHAELFHNLLNWGICCDTGICDCMCSRREFLTCSSKIKKKFQLVSFSRLLFWKTNLLEVIQCLSRSPLCGELVRKPGCDVSYFPP